MQSYNHDLFIPIRQTSIDRLLAIGEKNRTEKLPNSNQKIKKILEQLHPCELPTLLVIQHLPALIKNTPTQSAVEKFIANAFSLGNTLNIMVSTDAMIIEILKVLCLKKIGQGASLINYFSLRFMTLNEIEGRSYLNMSGDWCFYFKERHFRQKREGRKIFADSDIYLTDSQHRIINTVRSDIDDHLHVEGYAGTGKSFQINAILSAFNSCNVELRRVMILTHSYAQYMTLKPRLPPEVRIKTFGWFAKDMIPEDLTRDGYLHLKAKGSSEGISHARYAQEMNLPSVGHLGPEDVARAAQDTVRNYCQTENRDIELRHLPKWVNLAQNNIPILGNILTQQDGWKLIYHAKIYWQMTIEKQERNFELPIRAYQRIKFAALNGWGIRGSWFSHILIDESHDLSAPMAQVLAQINLPVISLGDRYQSLNSVSKLRSQAVRPRYIFESVRAGAGLDSIVNPILNAHPIEPIQKFIGDHSRRTEIQIYTRIQVPEHGTAIFVSSDWGLFEWAQRLSGEGQHFRLLGTFDQLNQFAVDVIELYHRGIRPRRGVLLQYTNWDQVYKRFSSNQSFKIIHSMLERGLDQSHWQRTAQMISNNVSAPYVLSTLYNARNSEFDQVYLTPDIMDLSWSPSIKPTSIVASELYIGTTRVKKKLHLPESMMQWIEEHVSRHKA